MDFKIIVHQNKLTCYLHFSTDFLGFSRILGQNSHVNATLKNQPVIQGPL